MTHTSVIVLWVYIALLEVGGLAGFLKAGSKVSLIMSSVFALLLILCAVGIIKSEPVAHGLILLLLIIFIVRLVKTKKFMPAGLMTILTAVTLGVLFWLHQTRV